jgi:paraquat-inducible protein B
MSKPVNPYTIGVFLVGSLALLIAGILIFGSGQLLKKKNEYVIYFDSALNGLSVGAPVTLQGVQVGTVTEISLELDQKATRIIKPVVIQIDSEMVPNTQVPGFNADSTLSEHQQNAKRLIDAGLKAQLKPENLLTGILYVEFNFHRDDPLKLTGRNYKNLAELPSVQTTEDQIRNTADELLNKFRKLPIDEIVNDLSSTLKAVRELTTSDDIKQSRIALNKTLGETEKLVVTLNHKMTPLLNNMNSTMTDTRTMVQQFTHDMKPILISTDKTLATANNVLLESNHSLNSLEALSGPDAPLWQSLEAIRVAAKSTKDLTEYLQRHPDSLIYGKE